MQDPGYERPRTLLLGSSVNKVQEKEGPRHCASAPNAIYGPQAATVCTFLQVPGVPLAVHTNSVPAESMYTSPLA
jgi:hypothetical protein